MNKPLIYITMKNKKDFDFKTGAKFMLTMLVMFLFLTNSTTFAQAGKPNFSGTWAFNESKSTPSPYGCLPDGNYSGR
jgi:hypothetical protein